MKRFATQRGAFLSPFYARDYHGPVFRGKHPLPHQSQAIARDIEAEEISDGRNRSYQISVLSDTVASEFMSRTNCLPYSYFVTVHGTSHCAFMTHAEAQAWADAYGLGVMPAIPYSGIESVTLTPGGPMKPLRVALSSGLLAPKEFALRLLEEREAP